MRMIVNANHIDDTLSACRKNKKPSRETVSYLVNSKLKPQALKILTNPAVWSVSDLDYEPQ